MSEKTFQGIGVSRGILRGKAYLFQHTAKPDVVPIIQESEVNVELGRFDQAVSRASHEIDELIASSTEKLGKEELSVIKGQKTLLSDPAYCPEIQKLIREQLWKPEKAVAEVTGKYASIFEAMENSYMRERATDVRDAGNRLLDILSGAKQSALSAIDRP